MGYVVYPDWVIEIFFLGGGGGFLSCPAMSGLTLSMHLAYPSSIPGSGDGVRLIFVLTEQFS